MDLASLQYTRKIYCNGNFIFFLRIFSFTMNHTRMRRNDGYVEGYAFTHTHRFQNFSYNLSNC
jgi:hypothetical protein